MAFEGEKAFEGHRGMPAAFRGLYEGRARGAIREKEDLDGILILHYSFHATSFYDHT
jgi:hypothetical protein